MVLLVWQKFARNLLKNGYIRIGKYFARPYEIPSADRIQCSPSYITGISFNFFVHGENTVCTSVSIQRQPTLFRLSRRHLDRGKRQPVILGPWSLRAHLIPDQPRIVSVPAPPPHHPFANDVDIKTVRRALILRRNIPLYTVVVHEQVEFSSGAAGPQLLFSSSFV
ncbi:Mediator of RNA polymerase II transcription subunit 13 [Toxocara canis]|uniref:Mediator of RNA polymerase II transcription subunit 13 n=1 Tax=Toxocara canis TaxID=6265 RepID=A0A0B2UJT4_TOXCA|nr:Mediator of RNA polymerase II transcription subunit 13 [Toxocara canis]